MKKFIILTLSLILIITAFTACNSEKLQEDSNVLRVGMDLKFPPFSYLNDNGEIEGLEPTIAKAFAEYLGMEVEIVNIDFSMLIPALETGDVDVLIADMSKTEERAQKADFSDTYRHTHTLALVNKEFANEKGINDEMSEEDFFALDDAKFVGLSGTKGVYYPQKFGVDVTEVTEIGTGLIEVSNGISDILIASNEVHGFHAADKDNTIVYSGLTEGSSSSFVVKKGNSELLEKSNEFISTMYESNGLYDQIRPEWDKIISEFLGNNELGLEYITVK